MKSSRVILIAALLGLASGGAVAGSNRSGKRPPRPVPTREVTPPPTGTATPIDRAQLTERRILPAAEISRVAAAWMPELKDCWRQVGPRTRKVSEARIDLIVHPDGHVWRRELVASPSSKKLERCVLAVVDRWEFPPRDGYTTASVPLRFVTIAAPGAGPLPSCFSASGCPSKKLRRPAPEAGAR